MSDLTIKLSQLQMQQVQTHWTGSTFIYVLKEKNRKRYFVRIGKCMPEKCGGACCKFYHVPGVPESEYASNFGEQTEYGLKVNVACSQFKNGGCAIWKKKGFEKIPRACQQFPHLQDPLFQEVRNVCTFDFVEVEKKQLRGLRKGGMP